MIVEEERIIKELGFIYLLYALIVFGVKMDIFGAIPQWLTALTAIGALMVAYRSIESQREIARKRAAIDFFTKTETDKHTLDQYRAFQSACEREHLDKKLPLEQFSKTNEYLRIRDYLNVHELMGVGINRDVFDDFVCEDFWSGELRRAYRDTKPLIEWIQKQPDEAYAYVELLKVNNRWQERDQK